MSLARIVILMLFILAALAPLPALAAPWNAPVIVDDKRASIQFSIATESGRINGKVRDISGKIWIANVADPASIRSNIEIPVSSVEVDGDSRLQQMKAMLLLAGVQSVQLSMSRLSGQCRPELVPCGGTIEGTVAIQNSRHRVSFPVSIARTGPSYVVTGSISFHPAELAPNLIRTLAQAFARQLTVSYRLVL